MAKRKKVRSFHRPEKRTKQAFQQSELRQQRTKQLAIESPVSWGWSQLDDLFPANGGPNNATDKYWNKLVSFLAVLEKHPRIRERIGSDLGYNTCALQKITGMPQQTQNRWNKLVKQQEEWNTVTQLYRFRLGTKWRAYALPPNEEGVSYILWIDPSHEVWPSRR